MGNTINIVEPGLTITLPASPVAGNSIFIKNNSSNLYISDKNEKYTILSIAGEIDFIEDHDGCIQKRDEIAEELSNMFPNAQKIEQNSSHPFDPSGDSITNNIYFIFDSGAQVHAKCVDFEETLRLKNNWSEGLSVSISYEEIISWLENS